MEILHRLKVIAPTIIVIAIFCILYCYAASTHNSLPLSTWVEVFLRMFSGPFLFLKEGLKVSSSIGGVLFSLLPFISVPLLLAHPIKKGTKAGLATAMGGIIWLVSGWFAHIITLT